MSRDEGMLFEGDEEWTVTWNEVVGNGEEGKEIMSNCKVMKEGTFV